jgi:hypothetical protein
MNGFAIRFYPLAAFLSVRNRFSVHIDRGSPAVRHGA